MSNLLGGHLAYSLIMQKWREYYHANLSVYNNTQVDNCVRNTKYANQ